MAIWRHVLELIVNPFFLCMVLLGLCTWLIWRNQCLFFVRKVLLLVVVVFLLISTGWMPRYLSNQLESQYPVITQVDSTVHWVVVLSGGQSQLTGLPENALLSSASIKRLVEGVRLFRLLPTATLLLSGGGYGHETSEAHNLSRLAKWFAIPKQQVILEKKSINTADQVREIRSIIRDQPFYLVTSAIHMPRAMALCHESGLHPIAAPTDFTLFWNDERWAKLMIPNPYNMMYFTVAFHELLGRSWHQVINSFHYNDVE